MIDEKATKRPQTLKAELLGERQSNHSTNGPAPYMASAPAGSDNGIPRRHGRSS
jgi:hypothetical protein